MIFSAVAGIFDPSGLNVLSNLIMVLIVLVWKLFWYAVAIFKTIERKQIRWFTVLFIGLFLIPFDLGLVAIIYLILYKGSDKKAKKKVPKTLKSRKKKRK
jgi:hypothetical protein